MNTKPGQICEFTQLLKWNFNSDTFSAETIARFFKRAQIFFAKWTAQGSVASIPYSVINL